MSTGYLLSKSKLDSLEEQKVPTSKLDQKNKDSTEEFRRMFNDERVDEEVVAIKCPVSGDLIDKTKVRKVYFF